MTKTLVPLLRALSDLPKVAQVVSSGAGFPPGIFRMDSGFSLTGRDPKIISVALAQITSCSCLVFWNKLKLLKGVLVTLHIL